MWEVAVEGEGYVAFDAATHEYNGPFVFYTAEGSAAPVEGAEEERDDVPDEECSDLEEYVQVGPEEGRIVLEVRAE